MSKLTVKIKKLHPDAIVPEYASIGAGCFDLHSIENGIVRSDWGSLIIKTGLVFEVPDGYVMLIYSRSGHAMTYNARLSNCVGVIDSDYRGEVMIRLIQDEDTSKPLCIKKGGRIAQAMIIPIPKVSFEVVQELSDTERGSGGFGSTGA
jgi:dUTP pyrophosphatase